MSVKVIIDNQVIKVSLANTIINNSGGGGGFLASDRVVETGSDDTVTIEDGNIAILWNSSTLTVKNQEIPASTGSLQVISIMDFLGDSDIYEIIITPVSGYINRVLPSISISTPYNLITLIDTSAGWIIV